LHGLPTDVTVRIIKDFIEAQRRQDGEIRNYEEWLRASFGNTFAELFPMQYTIKYHTTDARNLSTDWMGPRLYQAKIEEVLRGALAPSSPEVHYVTQVRYPAKGGFLSYLRRFMDKSAVRLEHQLVAVDAKKKELTFSNGFRTGYQYLVSSIPLTDLIPMIGDTPPDVLEAAGRLACSEVVIVNLGIDRPDLVDAHWTYFYDEDVCFSRLSTPHLQSSQNAPPGCGTLQAECYFSKKYRPLDRKPDEWIEPVIRDLRRCGILRETDRILLRNSLHIEYANVIFDLERADALATVHGYLNDLGIAYCGRYGDWAYIWTDEAFVSGERAVEKLLAG